ncbi:hypothetical protein [Roseibium sp.]|uniref:hypothetical protein n=1 Tax=Roseibium sp. TaxID=1936156 RepID=UPI003A97067F
MPSEEGSDRGPWSYAGYKGRSVWAAEGDLRMFVSFGDNPDANVPAHETVDNFTGALP